MRDRSDERIHVLARLLLVSPLLVSLAVMTASLDWWGASWSQPMLFASVAAMLASLISMCTLRRTAGIYATLVLLGIGCVVSGGPLLTGGIIAIAIGWAAAGVTCSLSRESTLVRSSDAASTSPPWQEIMDALQLSENAKRVLFRDRELDLLRRTIQDDLKQGDVHAALMLCDRMGSDFGAVQEAEGLRSEIQRALHERHQSKIKEELKLLEEFLTKHQWVEAYQYAAKLRRLYPETPLLHGIEQHIADTRVQYRHALEARFVDAAEKNNVELAMQLLKELDRYLTPDEARKFMETADTVITKYRDTLGTRFKMAVSDRRWSEAIEFGEGITTQFPNTTMAREVRDLLDTIQSRADEDETAT
ncbi:MAG: hypothetical protein QGI78_08620 [Phycisphaerales bacterium]|nr:hypothetical protein [Phycisphaerales bacterium]